MPYECEKVHVIIQFYDAAGGMLTNFPEQFTFPNKASWLKYIDILTRHSVQCTILYRSDDVSHS